MPRFRGVDPTLDSRVVKAFDVVEHIGSGVDPGEVSPAVDAFALEHAEEALGRSVVSAVTHGTHAQCDVVVLQELLVLVGCELRTAIRCPQAWTRIHLTPNVVNPILTMNVDIGQGETDICGSDPQES